MYTFKRDSLLHFLRTR